MSRYEISKITDDLDYTLHRLSLVKPNILHTSTFSVNVRTFFVSLREYWFNETNGNEEYWWR